MNFILTICQRWKFNLKTYSYPITSEPANAIRAAAHGDINLITLLMGAQGKDYKFKTTTENGLMPLLNRMND
jgi:isopenicillin N synthase-like dioxygenase